MINVGALILAGSTMGKLGAHVDVSPVGHRVVEREYGVGEGVHHAPLRSLRMIALENRIDERAVDGTALAGKELGKLLAPLFERRRAVARPYERVECQPRYTLGMLLREQGGAQRARRDAVDQQSMLAALRRDVIRRRGQVARRRWRCRR
jgi:hypothetical protein